MNQAFIPKPLNPKNQNIAKHANPEELLKITNLIKQNQTDHIPQINYCSPGHEYPKFAQLKPQFNIEIINSQ